jgi:hypothetical protein
MGTLPRWLAHPLTRGLDASYPLWRGLERALSPWSRQLAMFAQVVLERRPE